MAKAAEYVATILFLALLAGTSQSARLRSATLEHETGSNSQPTAIHRRSLQQQKQQQQQQQQQRHNSVAAASANRGTVRQGQAPSRVNTARAPAPARAQAGGRNTGPVGNRYAQQPVNNARGPNNANNRMYAGGNRNQAGRLENAQIRGRGTTYTPRPVNRQVGTDAPILPEGGVGSLDFGLIPRLNLSSGLERFEEGLSGLVQDFRDNGGFWNGKSLTENVVNAVQLGVKAGLNLAAPIVNGVAGAIPILVPSLNGKCLQGKPVRPMKERRMVMCLVGTGAQVTDYLLEATDSLAGMAGKVLDQPAASKADTTASPSSEAAPAANATAGAGIPVVGGTATGQANTAEGTAAAVPVAAAPAATSPTP